MSLLVERFLARSGPKSSATDDEIVLCVKAMRRRLGLRAVSQPRLEPFLTARNIRDVTTDDTLKADGALVPVGSDFATGFRMILRRDLPEGRINFTVAHEICHTFFYERVPEIKFSAHCEDEEEERLCNRGAEELLMPALDVRRQAKVKPVSFEALRDLAGQYRVSLPAMLIRLRNLHLWRAELVLWHEMTNGSFAVKRLWGGRMAEWRWLDAAIPRAALSASSDKILGGHSFWVVETPKGPKFRPVVYEVARHRGDVLALVLKKQKKEARGTGCGQGEFFPRSATPRG